MGSHKRSSLATAVGVLATTAAGGSAAPAVAISLDDLRHELERWGITGVRADSYLRQRADNPDHASRTPASARHAGDPGSVTGSGGALASLPL
jgi:hypothetical protein